jgi:membrane protease YdiL (CAAX protease family)
LEVQNIHTNSANADTQKPKPWGFWATTGFSLAIAAGYFVACMVLCIGFIVVATIRNPRLDIVEFGGRLSSSGLFLALSTYVAAPVVIGLSLLFAAIRKNITVREYLCLRWPGWKHLIVWALVLLLYNSVSTLVSWLVDRPIISDFMVKTYTTAGFKPILWFGFIIMTPFYEEIFFRGFVFKGFEHSKLGPVGAVIIISLVWSALHIQFDYFGLIDVFVGGLLLGCARWRSKSLYVPIFMHVLQNLVATVIVAIYLMRM